jgi:hypothetical protein
MSPHITQNSVLDFLDARAGADPISAAAARIIRAQQVLLSSLENEIVEAEWKAIAHAVEIERIRTYRQTVAAAQIKRGRHAA